MAVILRTFGVQVVVNEKPGSDMTGVQHPTPRPYNYKSLTPNPTAPTRNPIPYNRSLKPETFDPKPETVNPRL